MLYFQIPIIKKDHVLCLRRRGKELCYFITFQKLIFYYTLFSLLTLMVAGLMSLSYWLALVSPPPTL